MSPTFSALPDSILSSPLSLLFASSPILWLLVSLGFLKLPAYKACTIGLLLSVFLAVIVFQIPYRLVLRAALEGTVLALLPILWVIFAAFYMYNISLRTGAMERIKNFMCNISGDRRVQALAIAWGFGGFLEAVAGFGTAVAIPASILIALGFEPFFAAIICLLANTIAVAFGVVGIPVTTLAKITELPVMPLSLDISLQLLPFILLVPFLMVFIVTKSVSGCKGMWIPTLAAGLSFAASQFFVASYIGPELPAIIGSLASFIAIWVSVKLFPPQEDWRFPHEQGAMTSKIYKLFFPYIQESTGSILQQLVAWFPYGLLLFLVLASSLIPPIHNSLSKISSSILIYNAEGGKPLYIDWILTPGTLIMISATIGGICQGASLRSLSKALLDTAFQLRKTAITVISIVSMAKVLGYSGAVSSLAVALAGSTGAFYPMVAPMIGALGTFITGSDTSSNVLFGLLQKNVAVQIGADPIWLAASNTSGACAGKLVSPQSIAIATTATGILGREGDILKIMIKFVCGFIVILGVITYAFAS